jgi:3-dehydroshikimate dehydratase
VPNVWRFATRKTQNAVLGGEERLAHQHVAFACDDALAVARAMQARGVAPLEIPGNWYDDLAARTDLAPERIAALRESGVLYDRDETGGELRHFCTPVIGGRVFFEVVERRGGYDGYGAANAPVRMAAQRAAAYGQPHFRRAAPVRTLRP